MGQYFRMDGFTLWAGTPEHIVRTSCYCHEFAISGTALTKALLSVMEVLDQNKNLPSASPVKLNGWL